MQKGIIIMAIQDMIDLKSEGIIGVRVGLMALISENPPEDFLLFYRNSLSGAALWEDFTAKRDNATDSSFTMITYANEIVTRVKSQNAQFRTLVEEMVKISSVLPSKKMHGEKLDAVLAIEFGFVKQYLGQDPTDDETAAMQELVGIYKELAKDTPSEDFIEGCLRSLEEILS